MTDQWWPRGPDPRKAVPLWAVLGWIDNRANQNSRQQPYDVELVDELLAELRAWVERTAISFDVPQSGYPSPMALPGGQGPGDWGDGVGQLTASDTERWARQTVVARVVEIMAGWIRPERSTSIEPAEGPSPAPEPEPPRARPMPPRSAPPASGRRRRSGAPRGDILFDRKEGWRV